MSFLEVTGLKKRFGNTSVLHGVDFTMEKGEVLAIIGSSGGGKTTLLRCLNFLEMANEGTIRMEGGFTFHAGKQYSPAEIREMRLHMGLVFQSFNLFPQYTALQNVLIPMQLRDKEKIRAGIPFGRARREAIARAQEKNRDMLELERTAARCEQKKIAALQIPRDTYVGEDLVKYGKINGLYNWGYKDGDGDTGISVLAETVCDQFSITIDNYVTVDMAAFQTLVDMLGGVEVTLETQVTLFNDTVLEPGTHVLDGETAEWFVRNRDYRLADIDRLKMQRVFFGGLLNKLFTTPRMELLSLITAVYEYLETDLTVQEILELALTAQGFSASDITIIRAPGEPVATYGIYGLDVWTLHKAELADILPTEQIGSAGRHIQAADQIHQGCLAGTGGAHNCKIIPFLHLQANILQHTDGLLALDVVLADILHFQQHHAPPPTSPGMGSKISSGSSTLAASPDSSPTGSMGSSFPSSGMAKSPISPISGVISAMPLSSL